MRSEPSTNRPAGEKAETSPTAPSITSTLPAPRASVPSALTVSLYQRALEIVDRDGVDALTILRLAEETKIAPRVLNRHIANRGQLIRNTGDFYAVQLHTGVRPHGSWASTTLNWCVKLYRELTSHPNLAELLIGRIPSELPWRLDDLTDIVIDSGVSRRDATDVCSKLASVTLGGALAAVRSRQHASSSDETEQSTPPAMERDLVGTIALMLDGIRMQTRKQGSLRRHSPPERVMKNELDKHTLLTRDQEVSLAWALTSVARRHVEPTVHTWLCASIGAGDATIAIEKLLQILARLDVPLPIDTDQQLKAWLSGYRGSDREPHLRHLVDRVRTPQMEHGQRKSSMRRPAERRLLEQVPGRHPQPHP